MSKVLQSDLIAEVRRIAGELGHTPTREEFRKHSKIGEKAYRSEFGGYTFLLAAAGLKQSLGLATKTKRFVYRVSKLESFTCHEVPLDALFAAAGNPSSLRLVAQPDTHVKYRDLGAVSVFLQFLAWYRPHGHLIMGDFLDAEGISHWPNDSLEPRRLIPEIKEARELLAQIIQATPGAVFRGYITGNHEDWIEQAMAAKLPELFDGLEELGLMPDLAKLLQLEELGIKQFPLNHFVKIGKAHFTHGMYTGGKHPAAHLARVGANIYYGHLHDTMTATQPSITGIMEAASLGCLCRLDAKFMKGRPTNWVHAFGVFEFFPDGTYSFICPRIIDGRLSIMGKVFTA